MIKVNEASQRSRLADEQLHSILMVSSAQTLTTNDDELAHKRRHQVSRSDKWVSTSSRPNFIAFS